MTTDTTSTNTITAMIGLSAQQSVDDSQTRRAWVQGHHHTHTASAR